MEVLITDTRALRRIIPAFLSTYLSIQGWVRQETWKDRIVIWSIESEGRTAELLVPLREQSDAYAVRMSEAVAALSQLEERSQLEVYYDLLGAGSDIIRLRPMSDQAEQEWSLNDNAELLTKVKNLLQAAARAAEVPGRPVYHGRLSADVRDYLQKVRLLPGYETSKELTVHSPVSVDYGQQHDMGDAFREPFPRKVTLALNQGLSKAVKTAEVVIGGEGITSFEKASKQGASANLCEAVAALAHQTHGVELVTTWAQVRHSDISPGRFSFAESHAEVLEQGAELLRQKTPLLDALIHGEIVRLDRHSHEDFDGHAIVLAEVDAKTVPLEVQFDTADRDEVLRAFRDNLPIRVNGNIHRDGRRHVLHDPSGFVLV